MHFACALGDKTLGSTPVFNPASDTDQCSTNDSDDMLMLSFVQLFKMFRSNPTLARCSKGIWRGCHFIQQMIRGLKSY